MQTRPQNSSSGSVLSITVVTIAIIGLALVTHLTLVSNQVRATHRSQVWNACLPAAEAGIEEALTHAYVNYITNMTADGWRQNGGFYCKTNYIPVPSAEGWVTGAMPFYYEVAIRTNIPYQITAKGYGLLAGSDVFLKRTVVVQTRNLGYFFAPLVVKDTVDMNGNNIVTDSYDSTDLTKSTNGRYDPMKAGDKGDVATLNGISDTLNVGNANIWGHVLTSPTGRVSIGPNGSVGDVAWQRAGKTGIEPGWWQNDLNFALPDTVAPFTTGTQPANGTVQGNFYNHVLGNGNYACATLGNNVIVTGNATLYVSGDIKFTGADGIVILPGANLTIYCAGATAQFNSIVNSNTSPTSFMFLGLNSNTQVELKGQSTWMGCVYAPAAALVMVGGGTFYGSFVGYSARFTGNSSFHYDESLVNASPTRRFVVTSWNEL